MSDPLSNVSAGEVMEWAFTRPDDEVVGTTLHMSKCLIHEYAAKALGVQITCVFPWVSPGAEPWYSTGAGGEKPLPEALALLARAFDRAMSDRATGEFIAVEVTAKRFRERESLLRHALGQSSTAPPYLTPKWLLCGEYKRARPCHPLRATGALK